MVIPISINVTCIECMYCDSQYYNSTGNKSICARYIFFASHLIQYVNDWMKDCILIYFICEVEKFLTYEVDQ